MEVILLSDVEKVGLRGDVVSVARGYARNYLLPRRLAEPATPAKVAELQRRSELRARHEAKSVEEAREIAAALEQIELIFEAKAGPTGSLFGSVTATNVADEIWRTRKIRVDRRKIDLHDPIKRIGRYEVPIEVFQDVSVEVRTIVKPEGADLPPEEELEAMAAEEQAAAEAEAHAEDEVELEAALAEAEAEPAVEAAAEAAEPPVRDSGPGPGEPGASPATDEAPEPAQ